MRNLIRRPDEEATPETFVPAGKQPHVKAAGAAASRTYSILRDPNSSDEAKAAAQRAQDAAGKAWSLEGEGKREEAVEAAQEAEQAAREAERLAGGEAAGVEEETEVRSPSQDDEETQPVAPGEERSFESNTEPVDKPFEAPQSDSEHSKFFHEEGEKAREQLNGLAGNLREAMDLANSGDTAGADTKVQEAAASMREVGARIERAINTALKEGMYQNVSEERHRQALQSAMNLIQEAETGGGDPKKRAEALARAIGGLRQSNIDVGSNAVRNGDAWAKINDPRTKALQATGSLKDRLDDIPDLSADADWRTGLEETRNGADAAKAEFEERLRDINISEEDMREIEEEVNSAVQELERKLKDAEAKAGQKKNREAFRSLQSGINDLKSMWEKFLQRVEQAAMQEAKSLTPARMLVKNVMDRVLGRTNTKPDSAHLILKDLAKSVPTKTRMLEPIETVEKSTGVMLYAEGGDLKYRGSSGTETTISKEQPMATEKSFRDQFFGMVMGSGPKRSLPNILKPQEEAQEENIEKTEEEQSDLPGLGATIPGWARPYSNVAAPNPKSERTR
jgi:hypothetical protein